jgi:probable HAF family extracellular repeat protein
MQTKICCAVVTVLACALVRVSGEPTFTVTDLGTLGGNTSTANSVAGNGANAQGMIVGSSTTSDNSEHAFLFVEDKMYDLNNLCDLSQTNFKVLTVARTISDSLVIIGDGITKNGDKHAFKLMPQTVAGGQWRYQCCQWVWIQEGGGWWWEEGCGCYKWHGPPGPHPPCPPENPPCWEYPLPCPPPIRRPTPTPTPTPPGQCWCCINGEVVQTTPEECREREGQCYPTREEALKHCKDLCWCCINGHVVQINAAECKEKGGQCYPSREEALKHCGQLCWCCINGQVVQVPVADCRERDGQCFGSREEALRNCRRRTPTPPPNKTPTPPTTYIPGVVQPTPTPPTRKTATPSRKRGKQNPTTNIYTARPVGQSTETPPTRGTSGKKKRGSPTPYGKP